MARKKKRQPVEISKGFTWRLKSVTEYKGVPPSISINYEYTNLLKREDYERLRETCK